MNVKCSESLSDISNPLSLPNAHLNKMQAGCLARKLPKDSPTPQIILRAFGFWENK